MGKVSKIVFVGIAAALMVAFFAPPVIKLHEVDMIIVVLIGVVLMVVNFIEVITGKEE